MNWMRCGIWSGVCLAILAWPAVLCAQRVQFPTAPPPASGGMVPVPSAPPVTGTTPLPGTAPPPAFGAPALPPPPTTAPAVNSGATLGAPAFDPYATSPPGGVPGMSPAAQPWKATTPPGTPYGAAPAGQPFPYGSATPPPNGYYGQPGQPSALFPNGFTGSQPGQPPLKLLDDLRLRQTWVAGDGGLNIGMNDTDIGIDVQFPHFFGSATPLVISPQFTLSLWDGPGGSLTQQLPPNAYGALLEGAWNSDQAAVAGANLAVSVGVFSDFNTFTSDSIRIQTMSYGWVRLTPQMMLKLGVNYIDRVDIKLLPAVGILWEPSPEIKFDIFFPKPKFSRKFSPIGTTETWLYLAAEYGGGSWTIEYWSGGTDQIDINDIRLMVGVEWFAQSGMRGMFEVGWVTSREVVYRYHPADDFSPDDTFMLRAGIAF
ncbi:MAG: hypothetical protein U0939_13155 [Pirellulales bacterium]